MAHKTMAPADYSFQHNNQSTVHRHARFSYLLRRLYQSFLVPVFMFFIRLGQLLVFFEMDNKTPRVVSFAYTVNRLRLTVLKADGRRSVARVMLHPLQEKLLCVPATSAPVERVFSHGGLFMRPHRARLGQQILSMLVFSKCNRHLK